jgi:photosystem II stability/assembly factor-like uncharacterized protein
MSNDHVDDRLEADLRAHLGRARVPAAPPSLRAHVEELAARPAVEGSRRRSVLALIAAALVVTALIGTATFVGSRSVPQPTPAASSSERFIPPGTMDLFVPSQTPSGDGWRILGGGRNLAGPPPDGEKVGLYVGAGLVKPLAFLGLPDGSGGVDPEGDVIVVADLVVGDEALDPGCGRIRFDGVTFDASARRVTLRYLDAMSIPPSPGQSSIGCRLVGISVRFVVALSIDHLPPGPFSVVVSDGDRQVAQANGLTGPPPTPPADATVVDAAGTFPKGGLWVRRGRTLWTSSDGARSWQPVVLPVDPIDLAVFDASTIRVVAAGPGSIWPYGGNGPFDMLHLVVSRTDDGGASWHETTLDGNFGGQQPVLRFASPSHGYLLVATERGGPASGLLETGDGGAVWRAVPVTLPVPRAQSVPGDLGAILTLDSTGALWAGSQGDAGPVARALLEVSRDGGRTWADAGLPGLLGDVAAPDHVLGPPVFFGADGSVAVSTEDPTSTTAQMTRVFRTTDGGQNWTLAKGHPTETFDPYAFGAASRSDWYLGGSTSVSVSHDAGTTWQDLTATGLPVGLVAWLGFSDPNAGIALVQVGDGSPPNRVYATQDGGASWAVVTLPTP